jgi:two-component system chemotaxis response regulator CheB
MKTSAVPILVITDEVDAAIAFSALSRGALEVLSKREIVSDLSENISSKLKLLSEVAIIQHPGAHNVNLSDQNVQALTEESDYYRKVVVIGSSIGGPKALSQVLSTLPESFPYPIIVAQHLSIGFIESFVGWLKQTLKLKVKAAQNGEIIRMGHVYILAPEKNTILTPDRTMRFTDPDPNDIYHPSCNSLFSSAAAVYGQNAVGIILTGMGDDGAIGIKKIKDAGGYAIAQDEESSFIFGMPKSAIETGCIDSVLPLSQIAGELIRIFKCT